MAEDASHQALRLDASGPQPSGNPGNDQGGERQRDERDQRQTRGHIEEHRQESHHQQRLAEEDMETACDAVLDLRDVVRDAREDIALAGIPVAAHGHRGNLVEKLLAQVAHHARLEADQDALREVAAEIGQEAGRHQQPADQQQPAQRTAGADGIGQQPGKPGLHPIEGKSEFRACRGRNGFVFKEYGQKRTEQRIVRDPEEDREDREQQVRRPVAAVGLPVPEYALEGIHR